MAAKPKPQVQSETITAAEIKEEAAAVNPPVKEEVTVSEPESEAVNPVNGDSDILAETAPILAETDTATPELQQNPDETPEILAETDTEAAPAQQASDAEPSKDPEMGDKTPAYMEWLARTNPAAFRERYQHRGGELVGRLLASLPE